MGNSELNGRTKKIVLIACVKSKLPHAAPAGQLYTSPLFQKSLDYARTRRTDGIYILSAKYGLVNINDVIAPYELTLNNLPKQEVERWSDNVLKQLAEISDLERDHFTILAGKRYYQYFLPHLKHVELPLDGLQLGQRLRWLSGKHEPQEPDGACTSLHQILANQPRFRFPIDADRLPSDGIYVLFEHGEFAHGTDRIVRVGTHRGNGQFSGRLREHFVNENKDRSIFRKNIGRALLNQDKEPRIDQWEIDLTSRQSRERYKDTIDFDFIKTVESRVTEYIQSNFSFSAIPVDTKDNRMRVEAGLIATVAGCPQCGPSADWLGSHSTKHAIQESGLWLVQGLSAEPLTRTEITWLLECLGNQPESSEPVVTNAVKQSAAKTKAFPKNRYKANSAYQPLFEYLSAVEKQELTLTFHEIETILSRPLPNSARNYQAWWSNQRDTSNRPQARAWMNAGYRTEGVRLGKNGSVRFTRE